MSDFVLILPLLYCWLFGISALVLGRANEKEQNKNVKFVSREGKLFFNLIFQHFYHIHYYFLNGIHHINLVNILDMKYFSFRLKRKCKKITLKLELSK